MNDRKVLEEFKTVVTRWTDSPQRWQKIADTLNQRGVLTPKDESWTPESARQFHEENSGDAVPVIEELPGPDNEPKRQNGANILRLVHSKSEDSQPAPKSEPFTGRVFVEVQSSAKTLTDQISSFLKRELRSLKDVEIGSANPKWRIVAMATTQGGLDPVAFMYMVSETLDLPKHLDKVDGVPVELLTDAGVVYEHVVARGIRLCSQETLQEVCRQIVASFDTDVVEPTRAARRR